MRYPGGNLLLFSYQTCNLCEKLRVGSRIILPRFGSTS